MNGICYLGNKTSAAVENGTESWPAGSESGDNVRERRKTSPVVKREQNRIFQNSANILEKDPC